MRRLLARCARPSTVVGLALLIVVVWSASDSAAAQQRMWLGFQDDPVLRYGADRQAELDLVRASNATVVRTIVDWRQIAPTPPTSATDPFDPAYQFADLDEFVRNAQARGLEVVLTIWGTPPWANGNRRPQYLPTNVDDFRAFAQALASRYSGRHPGYPFVRFYGIWNESNLATFLQPQFDAAGRIVSPAAYARLAAAGYTGVKAGSPKALVAIGETSSNGRDRRKPGRTDTVAPGTFARLVAQANPKLRFDAWAQHPYPFPVNQAPTQRAQYPNVTLSTLPRLERDLDLWFKRKGIPIWITEYGNETRPGEPKGVTESQQAVFLEQAIALAKRDPRVSMFVWFVFRDSSLSLWQSGLYRDDGFPKPAHGTWSTTVRPLSKVNGRLTVEEGSRNPEVTIYLRDLCANNPVGATVGTISRTFLGGKLVHVRQAAYGLAFDCTVSLRLMGLRVKKGKTYVAVIDANTLNTANVRRVITVVGT
jgi:cellulase (glycosyl hydrolase family 5)